MREETPDTIPQPAPGRPGNGPLQAFPEIVLIYCRQAAADRSAAASWFESASGFTVRPVLVPCGAKVDISHILRILEQGADGVEVVACPAEKCRSLTGSVMAEKRIAQVRRLLEQVGLGADRAGLSWGEACLVEELVRRAAARAAAVKPLGPNPMKIPLAAEGR